MKFRPFSALGYKLARGGLPRLLFIHGWMPIVILPLLIEKGILDYAFMLGCLAPAFIGLLWLLVNLACSIRFFLPLRTIEVQDKHLVRRSRPGRKLCNLPIDELTAGFNHQSFNVKK